MPKNKPYRPATKGSFKVGNPGKPKGAISQTTAIQRKLSSIADIAELRQDMAKGGLSDLWNEIAELPLKERVQAKLTMIEYIYPKLARMEIAIETEQKLVSIFGKTIEDITEIPDSQLDTIDPVTDVPRGTIDNI